MGTHSRVGEDVIESIAQHHGFSVGATTSMLEAVIDGRGGMAQFRHPEFGGSGQWMRGGMTMVSDMFNHALKARVDALCTELSDLIAARPGLAPAGSFQSQQQGDGGRPLARSASGAWWPESLGAPSSSGAQDGMRYAYFPGPRRLVLDRAGSVTVHDTLDHQIGGVSQQQSGTGSISFSSQHGQVDVDRLPLLWRSAPAGGVPAGVEEGRQHPPPRPPRPGADGQGPDVIALIERLADLHHKGILSDEEFQAKKAELLGRL